VIRRSTHFFAAVLAFAPLLINAAPAPIVTQHVRDVVRSGEAKPVGRLPVNQIMTLDIVMPLADSEGLKSFLADVYNPGSPNYHHFLTPQEFTAKFGPSKDDYDAVTSFAKTYGLTVVGGTFDGRDVQVKGPVAAVEAAFHVNMMTYQHPTENRVFYSPDQEPRTAEPVKIMHVSGLDNYSIPRPALVKRGPGGIPAATTGSGPSASFLGSDMRAAYYGKTALTGAGQNLGLLEYYGTDLADLNTYYKNVGQTREVPVTLFSTDGTSTSCLASEDCDDTEQTIDMTQAMGMAPKLSSLVMYIGSTDTAMLSAMVTHSPLPTTIGCSWLWSPADPSTDDVYFEQMASQGQNFFSAAGDDENWSASGYAYPTEDANVVSVGGTDLETESAGGPWKSETAWSDSGGGISPAKIAIPAWQQYAGVINSSNKGSTTYRNGPDVAANSNFTFYVCADQTTCTANDYGGTSFATPMWAAFIALANQDRASKSEGLLGFLNPIIYEVNSGSTTAYGDLFHDITSGTSGKYSAVVGYDLVTGWGSPKAALTGFLAQ
jgi:kumamolisin